MTITRLTAHLEDLFQRKFRQKWETFVTGADRLEVRVGRNQRADRGMSCATILLKFLLYIGLVGTTLPFGLVVDGAPLQPLEAPSEVIYSPVLGGYSQYLRDFIYHFWDPQKHRIRPTLGNGYVQNDAASPTFWQMAQAANIFYWHWKITHDPATQAMLQSQWKEVTSEFTPTQMESADPRINRRIINVSDDAAWVMRYLAQVNEVTGDPDALSYAEKLLASTRTYFADPNKSGCGLLYATATGDPTHQKQSSLYETVLAQSALYLYQKTGIDGYFAYAREVWDWIHTCAAHPYGIFFEGADLNPQHACYKRGYQCDEPNDITRGASVTYIGGVMGAECLSAQLYLTTGDVKYLDDIKSVLPAMLQARTFLRPASNVGVPGLTGNLLLNDRDAWTEGTHAESFAYNVLPLEGIDTSGEFKSVLTNTARSIIGQRTPDGYYSPDWSGPEAASNNPSWTSWAIQGLETNPPVHITGSISGSALTVDAVKPVVFTGSISGNTLTVSDLRSGRLALGQTVTGAGIAAGTKIVNGGSGTGGSGTYSVSISQSVADEPMTSTGKINVGQLVEGPGIVAQTQIVAEGSESRATGTYTVSTAQNVPAEAIAIGGNTNDYCCNYFAEANQIMTFSSDGGMIQAAAMLALNIHVTLPLQ